HGALGVGFDGFHQRIAGIDIHPGVAVGKGFFDCRQGITRMEERRRARCTRARLAATLMPEFYRGTSADGAPTHDRRVGAAQNKRSCLACDSKWPARRSAEVVVARAGCALPPAALLP